MNIKALESVALSVRTLSMDGVQKANSGHPGLPLGCAELGALLYGEIMNHNPAKPGWENRDRFILSAGHGSMFLYSLLHLSGYKVSMDDLKNFRQLGYKTPGHPEYGHTEGVETTTGPLGAGFSNAVGFAIAETMLAKKFNTPTHTVVDHYTYTLMGDGCMMEGVASEAASLAGHLKLGKLIAFYDSNHITIEGHTEIAFTEDVAKRFEAYGWHVQKGDMYDFAGVSKLVDKAKAETGKPSLIILTSVIGKGAPTKQGTHDVHGAPLGADEIKAARKAMGVPEDADFYIAPEATAYFSAKKADFQAKQDAWKKTFDAWAAANPELRKEWDFWHSPSPEVYKNLPAPEYKLGDKIATRVASGKALNAIAKAVPNLVGGSADLAPSNNTAMPGLGDYQPESRDGRTLHFGVREHAMGGVANGILLHGGLRVFCATFLVFADYMRPTVRLAALMNIPSIFVFTHDSIFVGEDGPTHQPIEHVASLRMIPNVQVLRPADAEETSLAWAMAMRHTTGPTVLALTRQNLEIFERADKNWKQTAEQKGAYIAVDCAGKPDVVVIATGSEVTLAIDAAKASGKKVRVVSMFNRERFLAQDAAFRASIIPAGVRTIVAEVGVSFGWEGFVQDRSDLFTLDGFGASGPGNKVAEHFGRAQSHLTALINK